MAGCAAPQPAADVETGVARIPRVSDLYAKATRVHVHRFRKPYVDERARVFQLLAKECDKLLAETQTWEHSARLTAAGTSEQSEVQDDIRALRSSLEGLRDAASTQDIDRARISHLQALYAYSKVRRQLDATGP